MKSNYVPSEEERYLQALIEEFECDCIFIEYGIIYCLGSNEVVDMDMVEKMNIDIIEGYVTLYTSEDEIYIVDFANERIVKGR
jgi:hypothetical protein